MSQSTMPDVVRRSSQATSADNYDGIIIRSVFWQDRGWRRQPMLRKRLSRSEIRRLRDEGATHVELSFNGHSADFSIRELLGGNVGVR